MRKLKIFNGLKLTVENEVNEFLSKRPSDVFYSMTVVSVGNTDKIIVAVHYLEVDPRKERAWSEFLRTYKK